MPWLDNCPDICCSWGLGQYQKETGAGKARSPHCNRMPQKQEQYRRSLRTPPCECIRGMKMRRVESKRGKEVGQGSVWMVLSWHIPAKFPPLSAKRRIRLGACCVLLRCLVCVRDGSRATS